MNIQITVALIGVIAACFGGQGFWTWLANKNRKKSAEARLMLGIGYSKLVDLCEKHLAEGEITAQELKELTDYMYRPYKEMDGNGTIDALFEQVRELPIRPEKKGA